MAKASDLNFDESMIDTVLAGDIDFSGTMRFSKSLMIKGKYEGTIDATGHLIVGPTAVANATVKAGIITNYGKVSGNVTAVEKLEMFNNAHLTGDVNTPELIIEAGCKYNGNCAMPEKAATATGQNEQNQQEKKK